MNSDTRRHRENQNDSAIRLTLITQPMAVRQESESRLCDCITMTLKSR